MFAVQDRSIEIDLSCTANGPYFLEGQWTGANDGPYRVEQAADGMTTCCSTKIIRGDMQIDLCACDEAMPEQIADRD
jgi:hypothetical protein